MQSPIFFNLDAPEALKSYLKQQTWLAEDEVVNQITKAGEGNMNFVARIHTNQRTLIFKQSRPWVEKYPQFEAPVERIESEVAFYNAVQIHPVIRTGMPALIAFNNPTKCALFEDLGEVEDYANLYDNDLAPLEEIQQLVGWLSALHNAEFAEELKPALSNKAMRQLNHAHLYDIPLQPDNGMPLDDITPGLQQEAQQLQENAAYRQAIQSLGELYLASGATLLHGDFYPGSWVRTDSGPQVIDPEFTFFGPASYDIGVCLAHLLMAGYSFEAIRKILTVYQKPAGFEIKQAYQFAGMEIMRRLIGVAQLPLTRDIEEKKVLLKQSDTLVLDPDVFDLLG